MFNEKQSIRDSARSLKKYGSTCNHVRNNEILIKHEVEKTDTLQGIALKYGCTVSVFFFLFVLNYIHFVIYIHITIKYIFLFFSYNVNVKLNLMNNKYT